jgi:ribonuclease P protein component
LPRHEADLSTQEAAQEPDARLPQEVEEPGREKRPQASQGEGPQEPRAVGAEEVNGVTYGKAARLRRRREFLQVQQRGRRLYAGEVLILALPASGDRPRIGITVSSKVANAVARNRVKRWVREAFRAIQGDLPPVDLVVVARKGASEMGLAGAARVLAAAKERLLRGEA